MRHPKAGVCGPDVATRVGCGGDMSTPPQSQKCPFWRLELGSGMQDMPPKGAVFWETAALHARALTPVQDVT